MRLLAWVDAKVVEAQDVCFDVPYVMQRVHTLGWRAANVDRHLVLLREASEELFGFASLCGVGDARRIIEKLLESSRVTQNYSVPVAIRLDCRGVLSFVVEPPTFGAGCYLRAKRPNGVTLRMPLPECDVPTSASVAQDALSECRVAIYGGERALWKDDEAMLISRPWLPLFAVYGDTVYTPSMHRSVEFDMTRRAIEAAGYTPGKDITLALDCAASEYHRAGVYDYTIFEGPQGHKRTSEEQVYYLERLIDFYPIDSIEDGMGENDWEGWAMLTERIGDRCQLVGDDLFVTNVKYLSKGIEKNCANSVLVKVNQIGTLTEALDTIELARRNGYTTIISHRSGETEDTTIADIAVAVNAGQIKTGSMSRSDRTAKYNQLMRIEEELRRTARYGV